MPKIKTKRTDILRKAEILETLNKAEQVGTWLQCYIAFAWVFGKRVNEVLRLKKEDVWTDQGFLYARFQVGKKKTRTAPIIPVRYLKRITLQHPAIPFILPHLEAVKEGYIFPYNREASTLKVKSHWTDREGKEQTREYTYQEEGGYIRQNLLRYYLKKVNPRIWTHLFRHSLATEMSERGKTVQQLMDWFDWTSPKQAMAYVQRGPGLTQELSDRVW